MTLAILTFAMVHIGRARAHLAGWRRYRGRHRASGRSTYAMVAAATEALVEARRPQDEPFLPAGYGDVLTEVLPRVGVANVGRPRTGPPPAWRRVDGARAPLAVRSPVAAPVFPVFRPGRSPFAGPKAWGDTLVMAEMT